MKTTVTLSDLDFGGDFTMPTTLQYQGRTYRFLVANPEPGNDWIISWEYLDEEGNLLLIIND
jgi:hypothetical protein